MNTSSHEISSEAQESRKAESNVVEIAQYQRQAIHEVQSLSANEYQANIKAMEPSSKSAEHFLPSLDISFACVQELTEAGIAVRELMKVGIPSCELLAAGFTPADLLAAGIYSSDLLAAGVSPESLGLQNAA